MSLLKNPKPELKEEKTPVEELRESMSPAAWKILLDLTSWAQHWHLCHEGIKPEWSDDLIGVLMAPFRGFGEHPEVWSQAVQVGIPVRILEVASRWTMDEAYRKTTPFPWAVIQSVAPALASTSNGFSGTQKCHKALAKMEGVIDLETPSG